MPRHGRPELSDAEREEAVALRSAGHSWDALAERLGTTRKWLQRRLDPARWERERDLQRLSSARLRAERQAEANRALRQAKQQAAMAAALEAREADRVAGIASYAEARRLRSMGKKRTEIASLLRMPYRAVEAAIIDGDVGVP